MKPDWVVATMDEGIMRREPTRKAAVEWLIGYVGTGGVISRVPYGPGDYEYTVGADEEDCDGAFIIRADRIAAQGWDVGQQPLYPVADDPYEQVPRDEEPQDSLEQGSLEDPPEGATVVEFPVRADTSMSDGDVSEIDALVAELRSAHSDERAAMEAAASARQRRRAVAGTLRERGKSYAWIGQQIEVTPQAVEGFLKYRERQTKHRTG